MGGREWTVGVKKRFLLNFNKITNGESGFFYESGTSDPICVEPCRKKPRRVSSITILQYSTRVPVECLRQETYRIIWALACEEPRSGHWTEWQS